MKKLFSLALGVLMAAGLVACGGGEAKLSDKVLPVPEGGSVHYAGAVTGGWSATDENVMEATSVKAVSEIDMAVAKKLAKKKLDWLYVKEGLTYGVESGGWKANFKKDGKIYQADASYTCKVIWVDEDEAQNWVSDPHTAHAESLNDNIFFPTWQEEADEDGFAWDQNPVVTGGAGVYTLVVAKYQNAATATKANYGMALIKTQDLEGIEYEKQFVFDHYKLVGSINEWNIADTAANLQFDKETNEITYPFAVGDEFQVVQADAECAGTWTGQMGASALDAAYTEFGGEGNIVCNVAGTYKLKVVEGKINITPAN